MEVDESTTQYTSEYKGNKYSFLPAIIKIVSNATIYCQKKGRDGL